MLLRSSSTPFLRSFLASSSSSPSSVHLRRAFSDGHLPSLNPSSSSGDNNDDNSKTTGLHTELSFSIYNTFSKAKLEPHQEQEMEEEQQAAAQPELPELPLFLARGMGIDRLASGLFTAGMGSLDRMASGVDQTAVLALDAQYKKMVDEQPGNALFLRNYAQFLHEVKCDARRAEEYYSRAMLADPTDGEIMSQYAKLVWAVHRDHERALTYFHKSVQAAPQNSHVLAAYASFLWEQEDDDDDDDGGVGGGEQGAPGGAAQPRQLASAAI